MLANIARATSVRNSQCYTSGRYASRMTRRTQLNRLVAERAKGSQAELATLLGRSASVIWQYLSGHREMGEKFARHVEAKLHLPRGWMDQPDPATSPPPESNSPLDTTRLPASAAVSTPDISSAEAQWLDLYRALPEAQRTALAQAAMALIQNNKETKE